MATDGTMTIIATEVAIGDEIKITTKNQYHLTAITGIVEGFVKYGVARSVGTDVLAYNEEVNKSLTPVGTLDVTTLTYVLIRTTSGDLSKLESYAIEWIDSCELVTAVGDVRILLKGMTDGQLNDLLTYLLSQKISARVISQ